jgi:CDGSH-type Zn-finger protein
MSDRLIAGRKAIVLFLEKGTHYWCNCGRSKTQPLCDGSHEGSGIEPVEFTLAENKTCSLCACKQTKTPPYCDGSHRSLPPI